MPVGHAHWYPPGFRRQKSLQSPLFWEQLRGPEIDKAAKVTLLCSLHDVSNINIPTQRQVTK